MLEITLSPKMIFKEISKTVVGQDAAKRAASVAIFNHYINFIRICEGEENIKKSNLLLMGPSGSGKTLLMRAAVKAVQTLTNLSIFPLLEIDCTSLSAKGWEGDNLDELIADHMIRSKNMTPESTVIFLDEIDKMCMPAVGRNGSDHNRNTQYGLLKIIEGTVIEAGKKTRTQLNTHDMLFVFAGNFAQIRHQRTADEKHMGFIETTDKRRKTQDYFLELEKGGMATQLVGRIASVAELEVLSKDELREILDKHVIPVTRATFKFLGHKIVFQEKLKQRIVEDALIKKTGARGLQAAIDTYVSKKMFDTEYVISIPESMKEALGE